MPTETTPKPDTRTLLARATKATQRGELDEALVQLKELLASEPDHEIANGMLAGIYAQLKMTERAIETYRRVLDINPVNVLARFQLGLVQLTSGQLSEAVTTLNPCLADKVDFLAHFHSGLALMQLERLAEARTLLNRAEQRMPRNHVLYPELQQLLSHIKE